jgi:thiosulfate reductase/polysulfide reductase chain A
MEEYLSFRVEKSGHSWDKLKKEGVILAEHKPITVEEGLELKFDTPSGKVEFWSDQLAAKGFDPVPKYTKHPEAPPGTSASSPAARRATPSAARRPTRCCTT